jgi:diguanylate cyclase (GGDEF)-like protein/PAS domain S-box-containing protein
MGFLLIHVIFKLNKIPLYKITPMKRLLKLLNQKKTKKKLYASTIIKTSILVILFLVVGINISVSYFQMRQFALNEAQEKANILIQHNLAIHTYFTNQLKPTVFEDLSNKWEADSFSPQWMSSTFAVREIDQYFRQVSLFRDYYYKEAAINARYPLNEADSLESEFLNRLNADPTVQEDVRIRIIDGNPYFVTMIRGETMTPECLVCHTTPENAPAELVAFYGDERSFNRKNGEVVSAISIRIPLVAALQKANQNFLSLSITLIFLLILLFIGFNYFINKFMVNPIREIRLSAQQIAENESLLGQTITLPKVEELHGLALAFNHLSLNLRKHKEELEETIQERTQSLYKNQRFLDQILSTLPNMVSIVHCKTKKYLYANRELSLFLGLPVEEILSGDISLFEKQLHPDSQENFQTFKEEVSKKIDDEVSKIFLQMYNSEGECIWLESRAIVFERETSDYPEQILFIARDVTSQRQAEEKLKFLGLHDALTGVKNRNAFDLVLQEMENPNYFPLTIMMGDVDNLKEQNDRFGHAAGDYLLQQIAQAIQASLRDSDLVARIGGDEFVMLLPNTNETMAAEIKQRILENLSSTLKKEKVVNSGLSLGVVTITDPNQLDGVMPLVDKRMYEEKAKHKIGD